MNPHGPAEPAGKHLVMIGAGHAHLEVLRSFAQLPLPGARLTLITREPFFLYSGMLPGVIAGTYGLGEARVDARRLAMAAGAACLIAAAIGLDLPGRRVLCDLGPPVGFDVLSIDIGAVPGIEAVPGAVAFATAVKPIGDFPAKFDALLERLLQSRPPTAARVGVVGAGAAGVELILAMRARVDHEFARRRPEHPRPAWFLIGQEPQVGTAFTPATRSLMRRALDRAGITVLCGRAVVALTGAGVRLADGERLALEEVVWAGQAGAASWPAAAGLAVDGRGFILVGRQLQSVADAAVFAAGDIATVADAPMPRSGVYAVRAGRALAGNLRAALTGQALATWRPQRSALALIGTADGGAIASRGRLAAGGRWAWVLKQAIDRRYVGGLRRLANAS